MHFLNQSVNDSLRISLIIYKLQVGEVDFFWQKILNVMFFFDKGKICMLCK